MANQKKIRLLDLSGTQPPVLWYGPRSSAPSLSPCSSCSASIHDISGKLNHVACFTCSLLLWIQLLWNKFDDWKFKPVSPKLLSPLSFCYNQEPLMRKSFLRNGKILLIQQYHALLIHRWCLNLRNSYSPLYRTTRIGRVAFSKNIKPYSPVTSINVTISPKSFLTFSFNPFATLV